MVAELIKNEISTLFSSNTNQFSLELTIERPTKKKQSIVMARKKSWIIRFFIICIDQLQGWSNLDKAIFLI